MDGRREQVNDQLGGFVEGGVLVDHMFAGDIEEVAFAVPLAHVLGGELGGLGAAGVAAQGLGERDVEVVDVRGAVWARRSWSSMGP